MTYEVPSAELDLERWDRPVDEGDRAIAALCVGPTIDVGCGPGRLTTHLAELGHVTLGIDAVGTAVEQTRERGGAALLRDVFDAVPGEGRWETVLLADGNVGIEGDPEALLRRVRQLLDPWGRVVLEVAAPGVARSDDWATLRSRDGMARRVPWSVVGVDHIAGLAVRSGLAVSSCERVAGRRWCAVLEEPR